MIPTSGAIFSYSLYLLQNLFVLEMTKETLKGIVALEMVSQRIDSECVAITERVIFYNHRRIVTIETKHTSLAP